MTKKPARKATTIKYATDPPAIAISTSATAPPAYPMVMTTNVSMRRASAASVRVPKMLPTWISEAATSAELTSTPPWSPASETRRS